MTYVAMHPVTVAATTKLEEITIFTQQKTTEPTSYIYTQTTAMACATAIKTTILN